MAVSALKDLHTGSKRTESLLESLPPKLGQLERGLGKVESEVSTVRKLLETKPQLQTQAGQLLHERPERAESEAVVRSLEETQRTLGEQIRTTNLYNAVFAYTATAITISAVYLLLRGTG